MKLISFKEVFFSFFLNMRVFGIIYSIGVTFEETDRFLWLYMMQLVSEAGFNLFGNKKIITRIIMAE